MLDELAGWGLRPPVVVADAGYGNNADFRAGISGRGAHYVCQVDGDLTAHAADAVPQLRPTPAGDAGRGRVTAAARSACALTRWPPAGTPRCRSPGGRAPARR